MNHFAVLQYLSGKLEILELVNGTDPIELARSLNAFLVGITASRIRAEFVLKCEQNKIQSRKGGH
jgi:hypothetical protein